MKETRRRATLAGVALLLAATGVAMIVAPVGAQTPPAQDGMTVATAVQSDLSIPLRDMTPLPVTPGQESPALRLVRSLSQFDGSPEGVDGALQASPTALVGPGIPAPNVSFEGVGNLFGGWPPDTEGDVGPNHYFQMINLSFQIFDKSGNSLFGPAANNTLFAGFGGICQTTNNGDPIVLYDALANRWFATQFAFTSVTAGPYHQCVAVSQTPDPLGAWFRYDFLWSNTKLNDYGKFGVWPDGYYMAVNQFTAPSLTWGGQGVAVMERDKMLIGDPGARIVQFDLFGLDPNLGGMLPSDLDGSTLPPVGAPNVFSEMDDDGVSVFPDQLQIWSFHVDWANTANSTFTHTTDLPVAAFDSNMCGFARNCIPQPGTTARLDAISDRLMYRLQYRNFGGYQTLVTNHTVDTGADHAAVRWYELRNTGTGWAVHQQSTFSPDATHRWMGSAAMNGNGDIALGYSTSSTSKFPSVTYTARLSTDPLNTMPQGEADIVTGGGSQTDFSFSRWGDYSMMAVDPVDDCTFWYTNEYFPTTSVNQWHTRIGSFTLPSCTGGETGILQGTVTDADTTAPIAGATVNAGAGGSTTTNASGFYSFPAIAAGTYSVTASAAGYTSGTANGVVVTAGNTTTQDFALEPVTGCTVSCARVSSITMQARGTGVRGITTILDENGTPLGRAVVSVHWDLPGGGTLNTSATTKRTGQATFQTTGGSGTYTLTVISVSLAGYTFDPANSVLSASIIKTPVAVGL